MTIRAKFRVTSIARQEASVRQPDGKYAPGEAHSIEMAPVYANGDPDHENSKFWAATPGGSIKLLVVNPDAVAGFDVSKEYYIDFTPA